MPDSAAPRRRALNPRQSELLAAVRQAGALTIEALAQRFGVTLQTVRRDVRELEQRGLLARYHGGVRTPVSTVENLGYRQRQTLNATAKEAIARAVARDVPPGCSLILNIGTTTEAVARALLQHRGLRVITNNLNVAAILADNPECEVIIAGGVVRARDRGIVGEVTIDFLRQFRVDIALIGISGIEADGTLRDYDVREVKAARTIIEHARQTWLCADHSKFGRPAMVEVGHVGELTRLYTDRAPPPPFDALLREADVACVVAEG
ncbi:DeoR/GlpR family DNA-binding transcription regulator [Tepidimonas sp.]|uniref:DeoR/GlpR family DNA-binding transcription regulator n=1 Tax=Tepidimonas sp. TaxID=2002775 RepID=UPI0039187786